MREYDRIADWYAATRDPEVGVVEVAALLRDLPARPRVIDAGCGHGLPIARHLVRAGATVMGIDSSREMVSRFRAALPEVAVRCERLETADVPRGSADAVVAWGVLFHLGRPAQRTGLRRMASWLRPGGRLLFTSGAEAGEREGTMDGVSFRYVSLGVAGYRGALAQAGMRLASYHRDAWGNHVYVAHADPALGVGACNEREPTP